MHDTAIWNEAETTWCCDPQFAAYQTYYVNFIMMGDTAMNNFNYKKIYWQEVSCIYNNCLPCEDYVTIPIITGFLREDSSKKVFYLADPSNPPPVLCAQEIFDTEKILYDFNLHIGDTVLWKPYDNVVMGIDSVQEPDGEFLRRISFGGQADSWIEGLGSTIAFFGSYMPPPFECGCTLLCAQASDLLSPNSPPPCGGIVNEVFDLHPERKLQISPDPFSDFISLTSPFQSSSILSVMNSQGQIILKKRLQPVEKISFTKYELPGDNFLFFRLISDEGVSQSEIAIHLH